MSTNPGYPYNCQILTDNFLLETSSTMTLGSSALTNKPISYKFGGASSTESQDWPIRSSQIALKEDKSYYRGGVFLSDITLGSSMRSTNFVLRVESDTAEISEGYQGVIECNLTNVIPSNPQSSPPDDTFLLKRAGSEYFYVNIPRNVSYRYYRVKLFNPAGTSGQIKIKDIFLGDSVDVDRAPAKGLSHQTVDPSQVFRAQSGREYWLRKTKYQTISGISFPLLRRWQVAALKTWSDGVGLTDPFWVILDPADCFDGPSFGASFGAYRLAAMPSFSHQVVQYWSASLSLKEAL